MFGASCFATLIFEEHAISEEKYNQKPKQVAI